MARATPTAASNGSLAAAKQAKNDEFYTQLSDIEKELYHYKDHFKGKVVFCNCDDPEWSNFWKYFKLNFEHLGLAKLIATHYAPGSSSYKLEYLGEGRQHQTSLLGDGDFRSSECLELLRAADIVVTNPPFSLFREYVTQLVNEQKKFLIIGNQNAVTYKEVFPLIKANRVWLGVSPRSMTFTQPDGSEKDVNACWFTNLTHKKRNEELVLFKTYVGNKGSYPHYDNLDAIRVTKTTSIPCDYEGSMGVPITFLDKYNPDQFEIVGITQSWADFATKKYPRQVQVSADGKESSVTKLNDGPALKVATPPVGETYYKVGSDLFVKDFARVIIKKRTK